MFDVAAPALVKSGPSQSAGPGQFGLAVTSQTTLTVPNGAVIAQISVEGGSVRYTDDGTVPTSTVGMPVASGASFQYSGPLNALQFTALSGSPTLDVLYYK